MINLKNKKILITGATGGIGNYLVEKFNNFDSKIIATGTNEEKLNNLKKKYDQIDTIQFKLDEHSKIEEFINQVDQKFNGIDISTISIFQQFLKQLDRVSTPEIRRKYVNELMDLRIDPNGALDAASFIDGATTLSRKVTRMYKLVKDNPTLSPTEARLLIRSMTSRILDLESSTEMCKFKEEVLKINEDAYNAAKVCSGSK